MSSDSHPYHQPMFVLLILFFIVACLLSISIAFVLLWVIVARSPSTTNRSSLNRSAAVVVLGDVGRSPRMCYNAQSLAEDGWRVALVGYGGTSPPPALRRSSVKHHHLARPGERILSKLPRTGKLFMLLAAPLKVFGQSASLFWTLSSNVTPPPELIIVQTPPALPTLFIVRLVGLLLGSKIIIDWHNLGHTILSMRFPPASPIVRIAKFLERWTGQSAFVHLCVTQSLKFHLKERWKVDGPVRVLYDRPPDHFRRALVPETHRLFSTLAPRLQPPLDDWCPEYKSPKSTPLTQDASTLRADRPALVVSSTSWTADEDFAMLLKAASIYEKRARELNAKDDMTPLPTPNPNNRPATPILLDSPVVTFDDENKIWPFGIPTAGSGRDKSRRASVSSILPEAKRLPKMLLIVTGKGELRDQYVEEIARLEREEQWEWVRIRTAWLQIEEYPVMLGSADIGVSLHSSSSGMDLPMKVVDMLGCGTPVCALGFPCIGELVQHGVNGLVFYNAQELATQLESLLGKHPDANWLSSKMSTMDSLFPRISSTNSRMSLESPQIHKVKEGELPSDSSRNSSPPLSPLFARPPSPMPSVTLLSSPMFGTDSYGFPAPAQNGGAAHPKTRTWSKNWKRVVRTLLDEADEIEEAEARMAKWEANRPGRSWISSFTKSKFPKRRTVLRRVDSAKSVESSPISSRDGSEDESFGGASGIPSQYKENDSILPRSSPKRLRNRTNRQSLWGVSDHESLAAINTDLKPEGIPGIEISPAEVN